MNIGNKIYSTRSLSGNIIGEVLSFLGTLFFGTFAVLFLIGIPEYAVRKEMNQFGMVTKTLVPEGVLVGLIISLLFAIPTIILIVVTVKNIKSLLHYVAIHEYGICGRGNDGMSFTYPYQYIKNIREDKKNLYIDATIRSHTISLPKKKRNLIFDKLTRA